jgi:lipopolysaccharide assembly outer membrane protein LptD (OstA)
MPETSIRVAIRGLGLSLLLVLEAAHADEPPCPSTTPAATAPARPATPPDPDAPITIESDDNDFEFGANGNARLCGNVEMKQGDRTVRADCLEYNSKTQDAKLQGGIEYTDPITTEPPSMKPSSTAASAITGMMALRSACLKTTRAGLSPLARAVRM